MAILAMANPVQADNVTRSNTTVTSGSVIHVSCYRGPWKEVIWDRPNPEFIQSLEDNGIGSRDAIEIAETICRDPRLVDNPTGLAKQVRRLVADVRRG